MLGWFAETTLVASALAVVAILAGRLRSIGPTARHALWLVVLIKMMTPPLVAWPWAAPWRDLEWPNTSLEVVSAVAREIEPVPPGNDDAQAVPVAITSPETEVVVSAAPLPAKVTHFSLPDATTLKRCLVLAWLVISVMLGIGQAIRIIRFRRLLRGAVPAPDDLVEEAEQIGWRLGVPVPELLVVPDLGTPLLWCLGRPQLLLPGRLVKTLPLDRWRGVLIHELAHLRRGDHWVSRLELAAGLIWWWNPLYWLTRARLDADAELACDAWVVWAQPKDRLAYAEVLFDLCATLSLAKSPAPMLGVASSGRFLERRLTMILHDHVSCRLSPLGLLGACLLVLFALPSWSAANPVAVTNEGELFSLAVTSTGDQASTGAVMDDDDDDDDDDADDDKDEADDDDDDDDKPAASAKAKAAKAKAKAAKAKEKAKAKKSSSDRDIDLSRIEKEIETKLGPGSDFEKKMEAFGKEFESKFGPEFEKKMEAFGKEMESKFGPEFEKKMEAFGKEIESKFGPEFEKKMEAFGKEMESKFGPGSEFEKTMKAFGKEMESKFGSDSEFVRKVKEQAGADSKPTKPKKQTEAKAKPKAKDRDRELRIKQLETQISKLVEEIKALKADKE